jgi:hypothetical protein
MIHDLSLQSIDLCQTSTRPRLMPTAVVRRGLWLVASGKATTRLKLFVSSIRCLDLTLSVDYQHFIYFYRSSLLEIHNDASNITCTSSAESYLFRVLLPSFIRHGFAQ